MQSKLYKKKEFRLDPNEEVTRIMLLPTHQETQEPIAKVMVKDRIGGKLGKGQQREKTIVCGDLVNVDKMVLLHHLFIESKKVLPVYFKDFTEKNIDPFDEKKEEKIVPKTDAPEWETPGGDIEPVKKIIDNRTQE